MRGLTDDGCVTIDAGWPDPTDLYSLPSSEGRCEEETPPTSSQHGQPPGGALADASTWLRTRTSPGTAGRSRTASRGPDLRSLPAIQHYWSVISIA
jgi:hypothetical protein